MEKQKMTKYRAFFTALIPFDIEVEAYDDGELEAMANAPGFTRMATRIVEGIQASIFNSLDLNDVSLVDYAIIDGRDENEK